VATILWHSTAPWSPSGYGVQTAIWTKQLQKMGHEVLISTFWGLNGSPTSWDGITVLPAFGGNYASPSLHQHAKHVNPDLVMTLGDVWVLDPGLLRELPLAHWLPCDCRPMSTADRGVVEASGAQLVAMSRFGLDRFRDAGFTNALYCPHAIDFGTFKPPEDKAKLREATGISPDTFVIGVNAANNDAIRKAPAEMLLAFAKFAAAHDDVLLSLHTGVHCDGGQDLECLAENLGITDRVMVVDQYRYSAGLIPAEGLADWYGAVDVLLGATYGEGFGLPLVEAMACGVPVITTKCSSMEELNPDGIQVDGEPFWNGVHRGWWIRPSIAGMVAALEQAYEQRRDVDQAKLRESVSEYEVGNVAEKYMRPTVDELLERMAVRRGIAAA
jgi:glycosyltransferase involved in cell wall biosynthesis